MGAALWPQGRSTCLAVSYVLDWLNPTARDALALSLQALQRHPRRVTALGLAALGSMAVTAFAVAPLTADDTPPPQRVVTEPLPLATLAAQLDRLAEHELRLHRSTQTRATDTADLLLRRLGVSDPAAAAWLRQNQTARLLLDGDDAKLAQAEVAQDGRLLALVGRMQALDPAQRDTHFTRLSLRREAAGGFSSHTESVPLQTQVRLGSGSVRSTLWNATAEARLPDAIADQMVDIFAGEIDFHRELRRGDSFSVVYEAMTADGEPVPWGEGAGRVLAAQYVNRGRTHQAVWFLDPSTGRSGYFAPDGRSRRRAFLASPLEFTRVTSGFEMRVHPIMQTWRAHNGVDYAAATGTPVRSVGDGTVEFAGRQSGYGNVVQVQHSGGKSTLYAHLSRIDVQQGDRVNQGQVVGAVGSTGWATGPHLHFELRINGQFQDPLTIASMTESFALDSGTRARFKTVAVKATQQLAAAGTLSRFRGDAE